MPKYENSQTNNIGEKMNKIYFHMKERSKNVLQIFVCKIWVKKDIFWRYIGKSTKGKSYYVQ